MQQGPSGNQRAGRRFDRATFRSSGAHARRHLMFGRGGFRPSRRTSVLSVLVSTAMVAALLQTMAAQTATALVAPCPAGGCVVTVGAFEPAFPNADPGVGAGLGKGAAISTFNFIINVDNTRLPLGTTQLDGSCLPLASTQPDGSCTTVPEANGYAPTESYSPIVAEGGCSAFACGGPGDRNVVKLPMGRYLITVRAPDHKMWGQSITLPGDADASGNLNADIVMTAASDAKPLPLGSNRILVFNDNGWTNGAPDAGEPGLSGFKIEMYEQTHLAVTADYHNNPLCADPLPTDPAPGSWPNCETDSDGFVQVDNLSPATYFTEVVPPAGPCNANPDSQWYQTTTIDGGLDLQTPVEEGASGAGPPTALAADFAGNGAKRTISWFGFVCAPVDIANPGTGEITGTVRNIQPWTSATDTTLGEVVANPFVSLTDINTNETIYIGQGDADGNVDILDVPAGTYNMAIWDEQLNYIISFMTVTVGDGDVVDLNTTDSRGEVGVGIPRWFGWLDGTVYKDVNGNGMYDIGTDTPIPNTDVDQRWRDGSIKDATFTDINGHYEYPMAEGGTMGKWIINEQGFSHFSAFPGPSLHDEQHPNDPNLITPSCPPGAPAPNCMPVDQGGGLLSNQLLQPDHRATVDFGKRDYAPNETGQIVGITYYATTRNEFHAKNQAHEDYEPAVPDVTVYLEGLGADGLPNTTDDVVLNKYVTDHWQHPTINQTPPQTCKLIDSTGADAIGYNPNISSLCIEQPITGDQTKDGAFDGGYAFADYCPDGYNLALDDGSCLGASADPVPLVAGTYITHFIAPKDPSDTRACNTVAGDPNVSEPKNAAVEGGGDGCLFRPVKEEDVNVDLGAKFTPALPPPDCIGDDHVIDQSTLTPRSPFWGVAGAHAPLCDKRLVTLQNQQNANADFNLMTNFPTDPNGQDPLDTRIGDVQEPGRVLGISLNDLVFETNPNSVLFGDNAAAAGLPVGIYTRYDTDPNHWRLFTTVETSDIGTYEALLPSLETLNCPIPQGPCPGMYRFLVDDPGTPSHPNLNYDPGFVRGTDYIFDVWPGQTDDSLDTPMIPVTAGANCQTPSGNPELLQVSRPYVRSTDSGVTRRITIDGFAFGTTPGTVSLADPRGGGASRTLGPVVNATPGTAGGLVSWTDRQIVLQVPATSASFPTGQKQLSISENGRTTDNGITFHVLGSGYNPAVVNVPAYDALTNQHPIQNALDSAAAGSLLVLSPGTYDENVVMWKPVKIQGVGVGGVLGAENLQATTPADPRFLIKGSNIDGSFFGTNRAAWDATLAAHARVGTPAYQGAPTLADVLTGADVLVLARTTTAYAVTTNPTGVFGAARIDGVGLTAGGGNPGAGGVQLQARADNTQITNNVLEHNSGGFAGGIGLGQPDQASHNFDVSILFDRLVGNGSGGTLPGVVEGGGVGIFRGSNGYEVANSLLCSNHTGEPDSQGFGGGISHDGPSPNGTIQDNKIVFNTSIESGGGIAIQQDALSSSPTGTVNIDRNVIQTNLSGNDGGGILIRGARGNPINIRNNMINDNVASDIGGAIMLHDSMNVRLINNTVANNASTSAPVIGSASATPHSAGLAVDGNSPEYQAVLAATAPDFSRPNQLRNNIFWQNQAFTLSVDQPRASLIDQGYLDFEVFNTGNPADNLNPVYSDLTNGQILQNGTMGNVPNGPGAHNTIGGDPNFLAPFKLVLSVVGSTADPTMTLVAITGVDPPDESLFGDYHINLFGTLAQQIAQATASPVIDRAISAGGAPTVDFDGEVRPQYDSTGRTATQWDIGADEAGLAP